MTQILKAFFSDIEQVGSCDNLVSSDARSYDAVVRGARVIVSAGILDDRKRNRDERVGLTGAAADATVMNERSLDPYTWSRTLEN